MKNETIVVERTPSLELDGKELEARLKEMGAEVVHPVSIARLKDPIAVLNGKVIAFWTE